MPARQNATALQSRAKESSKPKLSSGRKTQNGWHFLSSLSQACVPWAGGGLPGAATARCWGRTSPQETRREPVTHFKPLGAPIGLFLLMRAAGSKDPPCGSVPSHYRTRLSSTGQLHPNKSLCNKRGGTVRTEDPGSPSHLEEATRLTRIVSEHACSARTMYNPL